MSEIFFILLFKENPGYQNFLKQLFIFGNAAGCSVKFEAAPMHFLTVFGLASIFALTVQSHFH